MLIYIVEINILINHISKNGKQNLSIIFSFSERSPFSGHLLTSEQVFELPENHLEVVETVTMDEKSFLITNF